MIVIMLFTGDASAWVCLEKGDVWPQCGNTCIAGIVPNAMTWHAFSGLFTTDEQNAIARGADAWDAGTGEVLRGADWEYTRGADVTVLSQNGQPDVVEEPASWFPSNDVLASTALYFGGANGCGAWADSIVVFNSDIDWEPNFLPNRAHSADPTDYGPFSMEAVALHEFGHVVGLDHEDDQPAALNTFYPGACDYGNTILVGEDEYAALVNFHPDASTGDNIALAKYNIWDSDLSGGMAIQEVWSSDTLTPDENEYHLGRWYACQGETWAVSELIEPLMLSTMSTTATLSSVDVQWRVTPDGESCFGPNSLQFGTFSVGLVVNTPVTTVIPSTNTTIPANQPTGGYKVCAQADYTNEFSETRETDNLVIADRLLYVYDPAVDPWFCN